MSLAARAAQPLDAAALPDAHGQMEEPHQDAAHRLADALLEVAHRAGRQAADTRVADNRAAERVAWGAEHASLSGSH